MSNPVSALFPRAEGSNADATGPQHSNFASANALVDRSDLNAAIRNAATIGAMPSDGSGTIICSLSGAQACQSASAESVPTASMEETPSHGLRLIG